MVLIYLCIFFFFVDGRFKSSLLSCSMGARAIDGQDHLNQETLFFFSVTQEISVSSNRPLLINIYD